MKVFLSRSMGWSLVWGTRSSVPCDRFRFWLSLWSGPEGFSQVGKFCQHLGLVFNDNIRASRGRTELRVLLIDGEENGCWWMIWLWRSARFSRYCVASGRALLRVGVCSRCFVIPWGRFPVRGEWERNGREITGHLTLQRLPPISFGVGFPLTTGHVDKNREG